MGVTYLFDGSKDGEVEVRPAAFAGRDAADDLCAVANRVFGVGSGLPPVSISRVCKYMVVHPVGRHAA